MLTLFSSRKPVVFALVAVLSLVLAASASARSLYQLGTERLTLNAELSPAAVEAQRIHVDVGLLSRAPARLDLPLLDGSVVSLVAKDAIETRGPGNLVWRGGGAESAHISTTLTLAHGFVAGRVEVGSFQTGFTVYEITPLADGGHVLQKLDGARFPPCGQDHGDAEMTDAQHAALHAAEASLAKAGLPAPSFAEATATARRGQRGLQAPNEELTLIVFYTPQARSAAGGVGQIVATAQAAVDNSNTAFMNSAMNMRYTLLHTDLINYNDTGDVFADRNWLQASPEARLARNEWGADMVGLLVNTSSFCGVAFLMGNQSVASFEDFGYQVTVRNCAVGNLTFAHEHGHNMGFQHNPQSGASPSNAFRTYAYGHFVSGSYRTVMSYSSSCSGGCTRVTQHSNPNIIFNGVPTGIDRQRDNARVGGEVAAGVAAWRGTGVRIFTGDFETGGVEGWNGF
ncbi:MAG: M12 family metallo-peptidase [Acidobacteriota bacterium]